MTYYLCQWTTPTSTTNKWVVGTQSLHSNNITLDHNLVLVNKFTQNNHKEKTLATYDSCINFKQSTDQSFIHPPINAPSLTLSIKECNMGKDITSNKPTIQIHGKDSNIFNQTWTYVNTIPLMQLQWLWEVSTIALDIMWPTSYNPHSKILSW